MKIRPKVALLLALMAAPSFAVVSWFRDDIERRVHRERRVERIRDFLAQKVPQGCLLMPERWRGQRGPGAVMHAYDASFVSVNPRAPVISVATLEPMADEGVLQYKPFKGPRRRGALFKVEASPECYYIGIEFKPHPPLLGPRPLTRHLTTLAIVFGISTLTGLIVIWPLVRRISRLTKAMQGASEAHPQVQVEVGMADELGDMARSFNQLGDRVQRNVASLTRRDEVLRSHVANTSHDLAIPLTVIQHRLRRALEAVAEQDASRPDLVAALEESAYMSSLVRNLNVSTKLEAHDLYFESVRLDLQDILRRVESRFVALAKMKSVEFNLATMDTPIWVDADPVLVEQAISNIVQNAVQYAPSEGHVALVVHGRDQGFMVRVIDDGSGIPEPLIDKMLAAGARDLSVRGRNPEGLGLGLSITRQVCALHGWTLKLENRRPERGLQVTLEGPLGQAPLA